MEVVGCQLTTDYTSGVRRELPHQFTAACNRKPPWPRKAIIHAFCEIVHCDIVSSGRFADKFRDKCPQECGNQASNTIEDAPEVYMVEVITESHM